MIKLFTAGLALFLTVFCMAVNPIINYFTLPEILAAQKGNFQLQTTNNGLIILGYGSNKFGVYDTHVSDEKQCEYVEVMDLMSLGLSSQSNFQVLNGNRRLFGVENRKSLFIPYIFENEEIKRLTVTSDKHVSDNLHNDICYIYPPKFNQGSKFGSGLADFNGRKHPYTIFGDKFQVLTHGFSDLDYLYFVTSQEHDFYHVAIVKDKAKNHNILLFEKNNITTIPFDYDVNHIIDFTVSSSGNYVTGIANVSVSGDNCDMFFYTDLSLPSPIVCGINNINRVALPKQTLCSNGYLAVGKFVKTIKSDDKAVPDRVIKSLYKFNNSIIKPIKTPEKVIRNRTPDETMECKVLDYTVPVLSKNGSLGIGLAHIDDNEIPVIPEEYKNNAGKPMPKTHWEIYYFKDGEVSFPENPIYVSSDKSQVLIDGNDTFYAVNMNHISKVLGYFEIKFCK